MASPLFALFTRSLREETRGRMMYFARGGLALFTLLLTAGATIGSQWKGAPGREFFIVVIVLQAVCVTIAGLGYFASAVTEEKEDMTLGLLRMTNLNPLSILLGKSTSRLCGALLLLAVTFPFALLAVTLGGISAQQIVASQLALAAYTFFVCNLALLASVIAPRTAGAAAWTAVALACYFGAGPLVGAAGSFAASQGWLSVAGGELIASVAGWLKTPSIGVRLSETLRTGFAGATAGWQVASNLALGAGCFLAAWAAFGYFCDRADEGATDTATPRRRFFGLKLRRPPRPWRDAIAWKEFHFACGGRAGMIARGVGYGLVALLVAISVVAGHGSFGTFVLPSIASFAFGLELAVMASRLVGRERREQTFSTLASLPLETRQILRHKARACLLALVPGFLVSNLVEIAQYMKPVAGQVTPIPALFVYFLTNAFDLLFLACLITLLSLHMLRGALPLGYVLNLAVTVLLQILGSAIIFGTSMAGSFNLNSGAMWVFAVVLPLVTCVIHLILTVILYRRILARLEIVVGDD